MSPSLPSSPQTNCLPAGHKPNEHPAGVRPLTLDRTTSSAHRPLRWPSRPSAHRQCPSLILEPHGAILLPLPLYSHPFQYGSSRENGTKLDSASGRTRPILLQGPSESHFLRTFQRHPWHNRKKTRAPACGGDPGVTPHCTPWGSVSTHLHKGVKSTEKNVIRETNIY